jgi:hypothetical protein
MDVPPSTSFEYVCTLCECHRGSISRCPAEDSRPGFKVPPPPGAIPLAGKYQTFMSLVITSSRYFHMEPAVVPLVCWQLFHERTTRGQPLIQSQGYTGL